MAPLIINVELTKVSKLCFGPIAKFSLEAAQIDSPRQPYRRPATCSVKCLKGRRVPRAWQPCGSSPPPLPRAADRVPCLLSRSCSSIIACPSGPRLPLSRCRSRPAPWPPWPSGARAHAAAAVLHASSQEPPLARPPWPRSRLAPPSFSPMCTVNHRSSGHRRRSRRPRVAKPPWATLG